MTAHKPLFPVGLIMTTPDVLREVERSRETILYLLQRHMTGDWGELDEEDRKENELSVKQGYRIFSSYVLSTGVTIWVITEADRNTTTLLLPSQY